MKKIKTKHKRKGSVKVNKVINRIEELVSDSEEHEKTEEFKRKLGCLR